MEIKIGIFALILPSLLTVADNELREGPEEDITDVERTEVQYALINCSQRLNY